MALQYTGSDGSNINRNEYTGNFAKKIEHNFRNKELNYRPVYLAFF